MKFQKYHRDYYLRIVQRREVRTGVHVGPDQRSDQRHGRTGRRPVRRLRFRRQTTAATFQRVGAYHLLDHAHLQALLKPTELASIPSALIHGTILVREAHVLGTLLHGSLEKTYGNDLYILYNTYVIYNTYTHIIVVRHTYGEF